MGQMKYKCSVNLTHNVGTREDKLTCLGANKCSC